jgi:hypothetical protein
MPLESGELERYLANQYAAQIKDQGVPGVQQNMTDVIEDTMAAMAFANMLFRPNIASEAKFNLLAGRVQQNRQRGVNLGRAFGA